ncbi:hypothetical protein L6452_36185 [Arctium lappa]|uniref:Uncharacterized protein n=1 Tax=Arctium lappa TaxID=4217 RepID=A0ACB8Y9D5_ARCLA|nr:hypothetical protein L6452_36185 [Arctium lappa]
MGRMILSNLNLIGSDISQEGKKLIEDLKKNVATIRFKSDLEVNKLSLAIEDVLKKISKHVEDQLFKRRKRKAPATFQTEALQKRARHEDQDPNAFGPHEVEILQITSHISAEPLNQQVPTISEPGPQNPDKKQASIALLSPTVQIPTIQTKATPTAKDKGKAITTEPLKKKSPPPST